MLDTSFGKGGVLHFDDFPAFTSLEGLAVAEDGHIDVLVRDFIDDDVNEVSSVARSLPDGAFDPTFGKGGVAPYVGPVGGRAGFSLRSLPDGKVIVGGSDINGELVRPALTRLGADGAPDPTFGDGGFASLELANTDSRIFDFGLHEGRLIGVGNGGPNLGLQALALRASPDGALDTSFHAPDGYHFYVIDSPPPFVSEYMYAAHVRPDGSFYSCGTALKTPPGTAFDFDVLVLRYTPDGRLDPSFGKGGVALLDVPGKSGETPVISNSCYGIAETPDGKIVLIGNAESNQSYDQANLVVARLLPDGTLDPTFGEGGVFQLDYGPLDLPNGFVMLPDGRVAVSGLSGDFQQSTPMVLVLRPDGTLDPGFGDGGVFKIVPQGSRLAPLFIGRQASGKLVVGGTEARFKPFLARLNAP